MESENFDSFISEANYRITKYHFAIPFLETVVSLEKQHEQAEYDEGSWSKPKTECSILAFDEMITIV